MEPAYPLATLEAKSAKELREIAAKVGCKLHARLSDTKKMARRIRDHQVELEGRGL